MSCLHSKAFRGVVLVLFGLLTLLGDALHRLPGMHACCGDIACAQVSHTHAHSHAGHCHSHSHAHAAAAIDHESWPVVQGRPKPHCSETCAICRWLAQAVFYADAVVSVSSAALIEILPPTLETRLARDIPLCPHPRGPPALSYVWAT